MRSSKRKPSAPAAPTTVPRKLAFWPGALAIVIAVPALFWLRVGVVNALALVVTVLLLLITFGIEFIPALKRKYGQELSARPLERRSYDRLGLAWLVAIPLAPLLGLAQRTFIDLSPANYRWVLGARTFVCVLVPLVCVVPLLRYVRGRTTPYALLILFMGTAFPISTGYAAASDFVLGAEWQPLEIVQLERITLIRPHSARRKRTVIATLADGRVLTASARVVTPHSGSSRGLVLRHAGEILAVQ